jgi:predicted Zn-dependent protease
MGCNRYVPSSTIVAEKDLATYNPANFSDKVKRASAVSPSIKNEDRLIVKAIWYEQQGDYLNSMAYYAKLYELTHKDEYLLKELETALYTKNTSKNLVKLEKYAQTHTQNLKVNRLLLSSYLKEKKFEKAKEVAKVLLSLSDSAEDYLLASNPYLFTGDFNEAVRLLSYVYDKTSNEEVLFKITTITGNYLGDIEGTIERLEKHRASEGCSEKICLRLLDIYTQQRKIDKFIPLYEELYDVTHKNIYGEKLVETYLYKKNYKKSIDFLQSDYKNDELLYALYIEMKEYDKANTLSKRLLVETKDPKWYAESAMALYEGSSNKQDKKMLNEVVAQFEQALNNGVKNSVYLNYYGYTLIDNDLDVKKGLNIIKKALSTEPENTYYLDSLAWGHYKLGECKKAYNIMKKVVDIEGLEEKELIEHWSAIQRKCK